MKLAVLVAFFILFSSSAQAGAVRVVDGDGLEINGEKFRLWGIDAPELNQTCKQDSLSFPCGLFARSLLQSLIGQDIPECEKINTDRYRRTVARCLVNGLDLGSMMVNAGWALDFEAYSNGHYQIEQAAAKKAERGLWGSGFVPPWEWRKQ